MTIHQADVWLSWSAKEDLAIWEIMGCWMQV